MHSRYRRKAAVILRNAGVSLLLASLTVSAVGMTQAGMVYADDIEGSGITSGTKGTSERDAAKSEKEAAKYEYILNNITLEDVNTEVGRIVPFNVSSEDKFHAKIKGLSYGANKGTSDKEGFLQVLGDNLIARIKDGELLGKSGWVPDSWTMKNVSPGLHQMSRYNAKESFWEGALNDIKEFFGDKQDHSEYNESKGMDALYVSKEGKLKAEFWGYKRGVCIIKVHLTINAAKRGEGGGDLDGVPTDPAEMAQSMDDQYEIDDEMFWEDIKENFQDTENVPNGEKALSILFGEDSDLQKQFAMSFGGGGDVQTELINELNWYQANAKMSDGQKYKDWYGMNDNWCAMFASWFYNTKYGINIKDGGSQSIGGSLQKLGYQMKGRDYTPQAGDLVIYKSKIDPKRGHVAICMGDGGMDKGTVVGGNQGQGAGIPRGVTRSRLAEGSKRTFIGYIAMNLGGMAGGFKSGVALRGGANKEKLFNYFVDQGFTPQAAAAMVGNAIQETAGDLDHDIDPASGVASAYDRSQPHPFGVFQMEGDRKLRLVQLSISKYGASPTHPVSLEAQAESVMLELASQLKIYSGRTPKHITVKGKTYPGLYGYPERITVDQFKAITDISKATIIFVQCYEIAGIPRIEKRIRFAQATYDMYGRK